MKLEATLHKRYLLYAVVAIVISGAAIWPWISNYEEALKNEVLATEQIAQRHFEQLMHKELFERSADLRLLSGSSEVTNYLDQPDEAHRAALEAKLVNLAVIYKNYYQLRLLDAHGQEVIRVNHDNGQVQIVNPAHLQNKADRPYFKAAMSLPPGQIHVSPFDLNMEHGHVTIPFQPTIRLVTALHNSAGARPHLLVLNFNAQHLLSLLRQSGMSNDNQPMLLNSAGYWLNHPNSGLEWGWQMGHPELKMGNVHPEVWQAMQEQPTGAVNTSEGVFLYKRLRPLDFVHDVLSSVTATERLGMKYPEMTAYQWYMVTYLPQREWLSQSFIRQPWVWSVLAVLAAVTGLGMWAMVVQGQLKRRLKAEHERNEQELNDLYENAPCGYHCIDPQGVVQRMNRTELNWLGYEHDEIVGRMPFLNLVAPAHRDETQACFQRFVENGKVTNHQTQLVRRDGQTIDVSLTASALRDARGQFLSSRTTVVDVTESRRLQRELEREARTDSLTGALNRREFTQLAERELSRARHDGKPISLLMIDIDLFKTINDRYGHHTGDLALKALTATCSAQLRGHDVFARMGGEEFAALLTHSDQNAASQVAERIRSAVEDMVLPLGDGQSLRLTVSLGVAHAPEGQTHLENLLQQADANLYRAKNTGRNRVCT